MGFLGSILDPLGIFGGGNNSSSGVDPNAGLFAQANASREVAISQSNAQVTISQTQAATMQLGILKSSQDAQFQTLSWLTDRLDSNDTKMQIAVENAKLAFQKESDHHVEAMSQLKNDARQQEIDAADLQNQSSSNTTETSSFLA